MQTPILHLGVKSVCRNSQNKILQRNLNANFGGKIQSDVFPVRGLRSTPNFTHRRMLGTCTRRRNPRSITSNRSKVIQEKRFPEIAKIGFLRLEGHKIPKEVSKPKAGPPEAYPHSIWTNLPNLIKIVGPVFERHGSGATPKNDVKHFRKILLPVSFGART